MSVDEIHRRALTAGRTMWEKLPSGGRFESVCDLTEPELFVIPLWAIDITVDTFEVRCAGFSTTVDYKNVLLLNLLMLPKLRPVHDFHYCGWRHRGRYFPWQAMQHCMPRGPEIIWGVIRKIVIRPNMHVSVVLTLNAPVFCRFSHLK